jgi:hypothetical protein
MPASRRRPPVPATRSHSRTAAIPKRAARRVDTDAPSSYASLPKMPMAPNDTAEARQRTTPVGDMASILPCRMRRNNSAFYRADAAKRARIAEEWPSRMINQAVDNPT